MSGLLARISAGARGGDREPPSASREASLRQVGSSPASQASSMSASQPGSLRKSTINTYRNFPTWSEILSGPNFSGGMQVSAELSRWCACFKINAHEAFICHVPEQLERVRPHLNSMRNELVNQRLSCSSEYVAVTEAVLAEARKAAESRRSTSSAAAGATQYESAELFRSWIQAAKKISATDLHLEVNGGGRGQVLARIDGYLEPLEGTGGGLSDAKVLNAIKAAYESLADRHSNSDGTFSEAKSMSCMISQKLNIPDLRVRFASQRGFGGPKAVCRLLSTDVRTQTMGFLEMGFAASHVELFEKAQRMDEGIVLQCGVTGSGKTTAAKAFLETHHANGRLAIYQVADPVEYVIKNVHQINVQRDIATLSHGDKKDPYSEVIETLMRMDPDIIDLGEIRDVISARAAVNVAKTGHMAMGTLHTGSVSGAFSRLTDPKLGLERAELTTGAFPLLLCYQALSAKLCPHCAVDLETAKSQLIAANDEREAKYLDRLHATFMGLPVSPEKLRFRNLEGCEKCRAHGRRGTLGLTIVAEMMIPDEEWFEISAQGKDRLAWRTFRQSYSDRDLCSENMTGKTVQEHAMLKAQLGLIDLRQVERFGPLSEYELIK